MIFWVWAVGAVVILITLEQTSCRNCPRDKDFYVWLFGAALLWPVTIVVAVYELIKERAE